jgi:hypothetical protein
MTKVYTAATLEEAVLLQGVLKDAGIAAVVHDDGAYGAGVSRAYEFGPTIWISEAKEEESARQIILKNQPTPRNCHNCGYDLRGLPEPRCPECGQPFGRREQASDWVCPACGEKHEGQFTSCWKCGGTRETDGES